MIIYKITNLNTSKSYIGQTCKPLTLRWRQHQTDAKTRCHNNHFYKAIKKYGNDSWTVEVVENVTQKELLNERENIGFQNIIPLTQLKVTIVQPEGIVFLK